MDLGLRGGKVIRTGGSRGIGRASLELFAAEGADVAFFSRNPEQVEAARRALAAKGVRVFAEAHDLREVEGDRNRLGRVDDALSGCDIFVHIMSSAGAGATGDWDRFFLLDMKGAVEGCEVPLPCLEASGSRSVIFMSSTAAVETFLVPQACRALKAALITYAKQLSPAWGPRGIRVNVVSSGQIKYPGGNCATMETAMPDVFKATQAGFALGRFGSPDEVARAVLFLASPAASSITGTNPVVDGGSIRRVQF